MGKTVNFQLHLRAMFTKNIYIFFLTYIGLSLSDIPVNHRQNMMHGSLTHRHCHA